MKYIILFLVFCILVNLLDYIFSMKKNNLILRFELFAAKRQAILKASREKILSYYRNAYLFEFDELSKNEIWSNLRKHLELFSDYKEDYINDYHTETSLLLLLERQKFPIENTCVINRRELLENDCWIFDLTLSQLTKEKLQKKFDKMSETLRCQNAVRVAKQELEAYLYDCFELEICISKKAS